MEVTKSVILLTGASGGLGEIIAKHLYDKGYLLALHFFSNKPNLPESDSIRHYCADLRDTIEIDQMMQLIIRDFGRLDVVINNSGISRSGMSWKLNLEDWQDSIAVNLTAPFYITKLAVPIMRKNGFGRIINISSVVGQTGFVGTSAYAASKSGLFGLTKTLAKELAGFNITVNSFALGYFKEGMIKEVPQDIQQEIINQIPMKQLGDVAVINEALDFVLSEAANYYTGQILNLNGGLYG